MRKFLILASALSVLAGGSASAQDFKVSNPNAGPGSLGPVAVYTGKTAGISPSRIGYNAADDFGPSSHNAAPKNTVAERKVADREIVTSSTGTHKVYTGYNSSNDFGPSSHNAAPKNRVAEQKAADREIVTSSTGTHTVYTDDFNVSDD